MKRVTLFAITFCLLVLVTAGTGAVAAPQVGKYEFDVTSQGVVVGSITVKAQQQTFALHAKGLEADSQYYLVCRPSMLLMGSANTTKSGGLQMKGAWEEPFADLAMSPTFVLSRGPPVAAGESYRLVLTSSVPMGQTVNQGDSLVLTATLEKKNLGATAWIPIPGEKVVFRQRLTTFNPLKEGAFSICGAATTDAAGGATLNRVVSEAAIYEWDCSWRSIDGADYAASNVVGVLAEVPSQVSLATSATTINTGSRVTLTAHAQKLDLDTQSWINAASEIVTFQYRTGEADPWITAAWATARTGSDGIATVQTEVWNTPHRYGFRAIVFGKNAEGSLLRYSESEVKTVECRMATQYWETPIFWQYGPSFAGIYLYHMVIVQGRIVDLNGNGAANQKTEILNWDTKEIIDTVYTDADGWFFWTKTYEPYPFPPYFGVRHTGDFPYWGAGQTPCEWNPNWNDVAN